MTKRPFHLPSPSPARPISRDSYLRSCSTEKKRKQDKRNGQFSESLVAHSCSNSKAVVHIFGSARPSGSNTCTELAFKSNTPINFPTGDVIVAFDNDQVVGKTYRGRENSNVSVSVMTSVCCASVAPGGSVETLNFKPQNWFNYAAFDKTMEKIRLPTAGNFTSNEWLNPFCDLHVSELCKHLQCRIGKVLSEQRVCEGVVNDHSDDQLVELEDLANSNTRPVFKKKKKKKLRVCEPVEGF
jgi:hypothetical protein